MVCRLCDIGGMDEVVVRVSVLAVALLHLHKKVIQRLRTDLCSKTSDAWCCRRIRHSKRVGETTGEPKTGLRNGLMPQSFAV